MTVKIVNLWKKENKFPLGTDCFSLDILSFASIDRQLAFVIFNFSIVIEY